MSKAGTIRADEARSVVRDLLMAKKLSPALWSFRDGAFHFLVGDRQVRVDVPAGSSFYGLKRTLEHVEAIVRDIERAKEHRKQIDIETLIREATP